MKKAVLFILISSCFFSCISKKKITYFNPSDKVLGDSPRPEDHIISNGDVLRIALSSQAITPQMEAFSKAEIPVKNDGTVDLPLLTGSIKISGLTIKQATDTLTGILSGNFEKPHLLLTLVAFPIIVMGEVRKPGIIMVPGENINIIQALILAGDLELYAKRQGVKVIRGQDVATQKVYEVDMTSMDAFKSEVYYLRSNDIVYVPPFRTKGLTLTTPVVQVSLSVFSSLLIIYTLIFK